MTNALKFSVLLMFALLTFSACKKDIGDNINPPTKTELLADGPWQLTAQTVDPPVDYNGTPVSDEFAQMDACQTDNNYAFTAANTYILDEGATKCDANDPQVNDSGTFALNGEETEITLTSVNGNPFTLKLTEVNRDDLILKHVYEDGGLTYTRTYTFIDIN